MCVNMQTSCNVLAMYYLIISTPEQALIYKHVRKISEHCFDANAKVFPRILT